MQKLSIQNMSESLNTGDKDLEADQFRQIDTIRYSQVLEDCATQLKSIGRSIDFSLSLTLDNKSEVVLSSNPRAIAVPYTIRGYKRIDTMFDPDKYQKDYRIISTEERDQAEQFFDKILNEEFSTYNIYSIKREANDCCLIASLMSDHPTEDPFRIYKSTVHYFERFICNLMEQMLPFLLKDNIYIKFSDFATSKKFRESLIHNKQNKNKAQLADRELICLYLASKGLTRKEIAAKLNISDETAKFYFKNAREKLGAKNTTHAVALAIDQLLFK